MRVRNFLTELDRDILIENKNVPYGRFSSNIVKQLYRVSANSELRVRFSSNIVKELYQVSANSELRVHFCYFYVIG